jgi:hypothetical protein
MFRRVTCPAHALEGYLWNNDWQTVRFNFAQVGSDLRLSKGCCWPRPCRGGGALPFYWSARQVGTSLCAATQTSEERRRIILKKLCSKQIDFRLSYSAYNTKKRTVRRFREASRILITRLIIQSEDILRLITIYFPLRLFLKLMQQPSCTRSHLSFDHNISAHHIVHTTHNLQAHRHRQGEITLFILYEGP